MMCALAAVSCCAAETLTVMTYNIYGGHNLSREFKPQQTLEVLKRADADLGGLNEVDVYCQRSQYSDIPGMIRQELGLSAVFASAIPLGNGKDRASGGYGVAAFAKKPLRVVEHFALPVPAGAEGRTALIVQTVEAHPVYLAVTHLPWEEGEDWDRVLIRCLEKIEARLKEGNYYPAILTGDMNRTPDSAVIGYLRQNWSVCNDVNPQPTWPANTPKVQIDYIAFQPKDAFKTVSGTVLEEKEASDHRPLLVKLERRH